jgi:hypothetical protein
LRSHLTEDFESCFRQLPLRIQRQARKSYRLWIENSAHPSLQFKRVGVKAPTYSVRVGIGWRAVGVKAGDTMVWFWIGSHADYDKVIADL